VIVQGRDMVFRLNFPEIKQQVFWDFVAPPSMEGEIIMFTANKTSASHLVTRLHRWSFSLGATKTEARRMVGSQRNAVWLSDFGKLTALSAKRTALLQHCLK
jgi:hypothetical protein